MREIKVTGKVKWNGQNYISGDWVEGYYAYKEIEDKHIILIETVESQRYKSYFSEIEVEKDTIRSINKSE